MITINLSVQQARKLLESLGWRIDIGNISACHIDADVAREMFTQLDPREMFTQLDQKMMPAGTEQANLAAWRAEAGYTAKAVEDWKRKNESMGSFE